MKIEREFLIELRSKLIIVALNGDKYDSKEMQEFWEYIFDVITNRFKEVDNFNKKLNGDDKE